MLNQAPRRFGSLEMINKRLALTLSLSRAIGVVDCEASLREAPSQEYAAPEIRLDNRMAAFGWGREDREWIQELAKNGIDPISSLGYDGPLASLSKEWQNISDYFKEAVAVVTNPAIDREREVEHFSTQTVIGARPPLTPNEIGQDTTVTLDMPILLDGSEAGSTTLEQLIKQFPSHRVTRLQTITSPGETMAEGLERIAQT